MFWRYAYEVVLADRSNLDGEGVFEVGSVGMSICG